MAGKPNDKTLVIEDPFFDAEDFEGPTRENLNTFTKSQADPSGNQDERVLETIENPRATSAGRHCIRASPFAPSADVSLQSQDGSNTFSNQHSIRASPFAAAKEPATAMINQTKTHADGAPPSAKSGGTPPARHAAHSKRVKSIAKRVRSKANCREKVQAANELFADQEAEAHISNLGVIDICAELTEVGTTTHDEWYGNLQQGPSLNGWYDHVVAPQA